MFLLKEALTFPVFFQIKRHGQEADIHLHYHNHRCIFEANSLRPTELSGDAGYNLPSSAGKSLYCNQPDHSNVPTGIFGRDFLHFLYIYCTTYKERIYGYVKFSRYQFMVYKGLINPKTAQKYEDYGIIVGFNYFTKKSPHISVQAPFEI